jgi:hypothetical protein
MLLSPINGAFAFLAGFRRLANCAMLRSGQSPNLAMGEMEECAPMIRFFALAVALLAWISPSRAFTEAERLDRFAAAWAAYEAMPAKPLTLAIEPAAAPASSATIGAAGGTVSLETAEALYTLTIPEDALFYPVEITLTPIARVGGLGAEANDALAVDIGPSGLPLADSAWLRIAPKSAEALGHAFFPFGFSANGTNAHYALFRRGDGGVVEVMVSHFSGFGLGLGAAATQALGQSKPKLPPPDSPRTARDAAAAAEQQNGLYGSAADALAGDTEVKSSGGIGDVIMGILGLGAGEGGPADPARQIPAGSECHRIEQLIVNVNAMRKDFFAGKEKTPRTRLTAEQWQDIKRCAEPPAKKCYGQGDPWPMVHYLKAVRAYRPDPDDAAVYTAVVKWLEGEIAKCARYQFTMSTLSKVAESTASFLLGHRAVLPVAIDLAKAEKGSPDIFIGKGPGTVESSVMECKVKGVKCTVTGTTIRIGAEIEVTLKDLPMPGAAPIGAVGVVTSDFDPLVKPPEVDMATVITAKGGSIPIEFEMVNAFWRCNFDKEFNKKAGGFRFGAWDSGTYPVIAQRDLPERSKACGGKRDMKTKLSLTFKHTPNGSFTPLP